MRIVLCTCGGAPGNAVLERLRASPRVTLAGVLLSTRILSPRYGLVRGAWKIYRRTGLRYALYLGMAVAPRLPPLAVPVLRSARVNDEPDAIQRLSPDLIVSAYFNQLFSEPLAALARHGMVNIHPSLLPEYRGVDPVFYARLRDAPSLGASIHRVSPEIDRGNILAQRRLPMLPRESVLAATTRMYGEGAGLLLETLDAIAAGEQGTPQAPGGEYFSWPGRAEVAALRRKGVRLV